LEARLIEVSSLSTNIEPMLEKAVSNLAHLDELYREGDVKQKRIIIGSIYPEKLTFDGFQYRTTRVNEAVELIYTLDKGFSQKETGQTKEVFDLSCLVPRTGIEPALPCDNQILSLTRLPVPPSGHFCGWMSLENRDAILRNWRGPAKCD
jgi:site-specific DNA recombinase